MGERINFNAFYNNKDPMFQLSWVLTYENDLKPAEVAMIYYDKRTSEPVREHIRGLLKEMNAYTELGLLNLDYKNYIRDFTTKAREITSERDLKTYEF